MVLILQLLAVAVVVVVILMWMSTVQLPSLDRVTAKYFKLSTYCHIVHVDLCFAGVNKTFLL